MIITRIRNAFGNLEFIRWVFFSGVSFSVVFGVTTLLHEILGVDEHYSFLFPLILVFFLNFFTCRYFVFKSSSNPFFRQFMEYTFSALGFRALEYLIYWILIDIVSITYISAMILVMPTSFIIKFLYYHMLVFNPFRKHIHDVSS